MLSKVHSPRRNLYDPFYFLYYIIYFMNCQLFLVFILQYFKNYTLKIDFFDILLYNNVN